MPPHSDHEPDARAGDDTLDVLGAFLHRMASPLGAIANYVHVLPQDDMGCRDGIADAVTQS